MSELPSSPTHYTVLAIIIDVQALQAAAAAASASGIPNVQEVVISRSGESYPMESKWFTAVEFLEKLGFHV